MIPKTHPDSALVARILGEDPSAFTELVLMYRPQVVSVARRYLRNDFDAEDMSQEVFLRAYWKMGHFRGNASVCTWLCQITRNLCINKLDYYKRRMRRETISLDERISEASSTTVSETIASDSSTPSHSISVKEFRRAVLDCLQNLTHVQRKIIELRVFRAQSYVDIARKLRIEEGTVKSRLFRARENLRIVVSEQYPGLVDEYRG